MHLQHFKTELVTSSSSALLFDHYDSTEAANIPVTADDDRVPLTPIHHHHRMNKDKFFESAILCAADTASSAATEAVIHSLRKAIGLKQRFQSTREVLFEEKQDEGKKEGATDVQYA